LSHPDFIATCKFSVFASSRSFSTRSDFSHNSLGTSLSHKLTSFTVLSSLKYRRPLLAQGCCCSPDNFRLQSTQRSLTHHRLQCRDNALCFPVSYDPTEVGSPGDSWSSCISGKVLFFSWNECCTANLRVQVFLPIHEKYGCIAGLKCVGKNRPEIGTSSLYCADCPAL
jgi:hypothetical protein